MSYILHDHCYEAKPLDLIIHGRGPGGACAQQARHHVSQQEQEEQEEEDPAGDQQGGGHGPDHHGQKSRPLVDLAGHEVCAMDEYIMEASNKIEELLEAIRKKGTGAELEVKESMLHSSAELVKAIKRLVNKSKASERGDAGVSDKESNELKSRWTRSIICVAKTVCHGAKLLVDAVER